MPHNWLIAIHHDKKVGAETNVTNQIGIYFGCNHADVESTTTLGLLGARLIQEEKFGLALKDGCKLINVNYYYGCWRQMIWVATCGRSVSSSCWRSGHQDCEI